MQTIVLDGQEFVLVPKEQLQPAPQVASVPSVVPEVPTGDTGSSLADFIPDGVVSGQKIELATPQERFESIRVVETNPSGVPSAIPKESEYRKRFVNKTLTPHDVTGYAGMNPLTVQQFRDIDVIEADKRLPPESRVFYGPGVEFDVLV